MAPNRFHQNRTVSWLMSIPRSDRRSSTLRSDSGYFTYIITARRIISGELLKYRKGLLMTGTYPKPEAAPNDWSDNAVAGVDGSLVTIGIRPEHFLLDSKSGAPAKVIVVEPTGSETQVVARFFGRDIVSVFHDRVDAKL